MTPKPFRFIAAIAALVLTGCAASAPSEAPAPVAVSKPKQTVVSRAVPREPEIAVPTVAELIGQKPDALKRALGAASLIRHDLGTEIWQYRTDGCVLFLFLYPKDGVPALHHLDVRGGDMESCLKTVVVRARQNAAG